MKDEYDFSGATRGRFFRGNLKHRWYDETARMIAAYLLDRADQYDTDSPCWNSLADAAAEIMNGTALDRLNAGELDDPVLLRRVDGFAKQDPVPRPVDPRAGIDEDDCPDDDDDEP